MNMPTLAESITDHLMTNADGSPPVDYVDFQSEPEGCKLSLSHRLDRTEMIEEIEEAIRLFWRGQGEVT